MLTLRPQRVTAQTGSSDQLSFDLLSLFNTAASNPHNFSRVELEQKPCDHHSRIVGIRSGHAVAAPPMSVIPGNDTAETDCVAGVRGLELANVVSKRNRLHVGRTAWLSRTFWDLRFFVGSSERSDMTLRSENRTV